MSYLSGELIIDEYDRKMPQYKDVGTNDLIKLITWSVYLQRKDGTIREYLDDMYGMLVNNFLMDTDDNDKENKNKNFFILFPDSVLDMKRLFTMPKNKNDGIKFLKRSEDNYRVRGTMSSRNDGKEFINPTIVFDERFEDKTSFFAYKWMNIYKSNDTNVMPTLNDVFFSIKLYYLAKIDELKDTSFKDAPE